MDAQEGQAGPRQAAFAFVTVPISLEAMIRYRRRYWVLAACLSAIAGFVDAVAFMETSGFFVSFMSGNSTRLGVGLATAPHFALIALGIIGAFVLGVMLGSVVAGKGDEKSGFRVLMLVAVLLASAAICAASGMLVPAIALMAAAMGAENSVFLRDGEVSIGLTYMTGTLVKFGQRLAAALLGGPRFAWAPHLVLWLGLIVGAISGASAYSHLALNSLWLASLAAAALGLLMRVWSPHKTA
jgi:uncharacterized membrane protein YoaK (UPF0700 family)